MNHRTTAHYLRPYVGTMVAYMGCVVLSVVFTIATALSVSDFLKILFGEGGEVSGGGVFGVWLQRLYEWLVSFGQHRALVYFSVFLLVVYGCKNLFGYGAAVLSGVVRARTVRDLRNDMHRKLLHLPVAYFSKHSKGETLSRFSSDVSEYDENVLGSLQLIVTSVTTILLYVVMLFYLDARLTLFTLVTFPGVAFVISRISHHLKRKSQQLQEQNAAMMTLMEETVTGLKTVKAYNAIGSFNARFQASNADYTRLRTKVYRRIYLASPVSDFMGNTIVILILLFGAYFIFRGASLSPELFISYIMLFVLIIAPSKDVSTALSQMRKGEACTERIEAFLHLEEAPATGTGSPFTTLHTGIQLQQVSFAYEGNDIPVLNRVSLSIPKGKKVALTGSSGSGKTTLMNLLLRYYHCTQGDILVDGIPLADIDVAQWRSRIGVVEQETVLFNDTVLNNIAFGYPQATPAQVETAARIANAHDFIQQLPQGYHTVIGEGGGLLSGGQRQRLSIARAVLRNPEILLLDEATSALDAVSEQQVQQALEQALEGRTAVIIAHRLSTIMHADEIVVLEHGTIVEHGTHQALLQRQGRYSQLWNTNKLQEQQGGAL